MFSNEICSSVMTVECLASYLLLWVREIALSWQKYT